MDPRELQFAAYEAQERATEVSRLSPDHGPRHWRDVARIALVIAPGWAPISYDFLFLFAAIHDTQREDEYDDPLHGDRAARVARHLAATKVATLPPEAPTTLLSEAISDHDKGFTAADANVATCWDADRLTLIRVGHRLDPQYFSLEDVRDNLHHYTTKAAEIIIGADMKWGNIAHLYAERKRVTA